MADVAWNASFTDRGTAISIASLNDGVRTAQGNEMANGTWLDTHAVIELNWNPDTATPSADGYFVIFMVSAPDGSTYPNGDATDYPGAHTIVTTVHVYATDEAQRFITPVFEIPPHNLKFLVQNETGANADSSTSTIELYTGRLDVT